MTELIKVRGLTRSGNGVRINKKSVRNDKTVILDLDNAVTRRDLSRHASIGQIVVVGDASIAVQDGVVASAGTGFNYSVTAGTLVREGGSNVDVAEDLDNAHTTAHATLDRIDLIHVDNDSGAVSKTDGTAAATPVRPPTPAGKTPIATVYIVAATTDVTYTDIAPRL